MKVLMMNIATMTGVVAAFYAGAALAQPLPAGSDAADSPEELRRYTIELIVFEYVGGAAGSGELFPPDPLPVVEEPQPPAFGDPTTAGYDLAADEAVLAIDVGEVADELPPEAEELEEIPSHITQTELELLDPVEFALPDIYEKLVTLDAYRPLMRAAWSQVTREKDLSMPIRLRRLGTAPLKLDGELMLYLGRYLHLVVDLALDSGEQAPYAAPDEPIRLLGDSPFGRLFGGSRDERLTPVKFRINEDRIFRNGELRYYDHPKFGVLARITRVEEDEMETDEEFLLPGGPQDGVSGGSD